MQNWVRISQPRIINNQLEMSIVIDEKKIIIEEQEWFKWWIIDILEWDKTPLKINRKKRKIINYIIWRIRDIHEFKESWEFQFDKWNDWNSIKSIIKVI